MRQTAQASSLLQASFDYQGHHPAGLWLRAALSRQGYHVTPLSACGARPTIYGVDQQAFKTLDEPFVQWPFASCLQRVQANVQYGLDRSSSSADLPQWVIAEAEPQDWVLLDGAEMAQGAAHIVGAEKSAEAVFAAALRLNWSWQPLPAIVADPAVAHYFCVSGTLSTVMAYYGVSQSFVSDGVQWHFVANPLDAGSYFTVAVWADSLESAQQQLGQQHPFSPAVFQELCATGAFDAHHWYDGTLRWPQWTFQNDTLQLVSQWPDLRPESLRLEGLNWGVMAHLFAFLTTRYSTPEQSFERVQNFLQKMQQVFKTF